MKITYFKRTSSLSDMNKKGKFVVDSKTGEKIGQIFKICEVQFFFEKSPHERSVSIILNKKTGDEEIWIDGVHFDKEEQLKTTKFFNW